jgi:serine phosphatase RsbU (regulator of sigma subunit)
MGLVIDIGVAKTNKYASRESGDTVEVIERPAGGLTVVMADGQGSGRAAKTLSQMAVARAVAAIKDGARDDAVAMTVNDHLLAYRHGQVSASLILLSFDLRGDEASVTRLGDGALFVFGPDGTVRAISDSAPAGLYPAAMPLIERWPLAAGLIMVACTDGIANAGKRAGTPIDLLTMMPSPHRQETAQQEADRLLACALGLDDGKPADDMSIAVAMVHPREGEPVIRRMSVQVELP